MTYKILMQNYFKCENCLKHEKYQDAIASLPKYLRVNGLRYSLLIKVVFVSITTLIPFPIMAAGFDCDKATKPTEILVCQDPVLSDLDSRNMSLYKKAKVIDPILSRDTLKQSIAVKNKCGIERSCIEMSYRQTIEIYTDIVNSVNYTEANDDRYSTANKSSHEAINDSPQVRENYSNRKDNSQSLYNERLDNDVPHSRLDTIHSTENYSKRRDNSESLSTEQLENNVPHSIPDNIYKDYKKSNQQMNRDEIFLLGKLAFQSGEFDDAIEYVKPLANKGDAEAQLAIGIAYEKGKQDYSNALRWYRLSATQNNSTAQLMIGTMYLSGKGLAIDKETGVKWIQAAANQGLEAAITLLKQVNAESSITKNSMQQEEIKKIDTNQPKMPAQDSISAKTKNTEEPKQNISILQKPSDTVKKFIDNPTINKNDSYTEIKHDKQVEQFGTLFELGNLIKLNYFQYQQNYLLLIRITLFMLLILLYRFFRKL